MCDECNKCCSMFWGSLYLFSGLALIATGMWMPIDSRVYDVSVIHDHDLETDKVTWNGAVGGLLFIGGWCVLSSIVGMAGTGCMSRSALIAFLVLGSLGTIAVMIYGGIISARYATMPRDDLATTMKDNLFSYYSDDNATDDFTLAWNRYQVEYACCGVENYTDYVNGAFYNTTSGNPVTPWTCCVMTDQDKGDISLDKVVNLGACRSEADTSPDNFTYLNAQGCESSLVNNYKNYQVAIMSVCWTCVFVQIVSMIASGCLKTDLKIDLV